MADADTTGKFDAASVPLVPAARLGGHLVHAGQRNGRGRRRLPFGLAGFEIYLRRLYQELADGGADGAMRLRRATRSAPCRRPAAARRASCCAPAYSPINHAPPPG